MLTRALYFSQKSPLKRTKFPCGISMRLCRGGTSRSTMFYSDSWLFESMRLGMSLLRYSLSLFAFLAIGLTPSAGHSQIIECRNEKGDGYPWAWREIDGRRCWYKGQAGKDKKLLRWAEARKAPPTPKRSPSLIVQYGEREQLLHSYWPPMPSGTTEVARAKKR